MAGEHRLPDDPSRYNSINEYLDAEEMENLFHDVKNTSELRLSPGSPDLRRVFVIPPTIKELQTQEYIVLKAYASYVPNDNSGITKRDMALCLPSTKRSTVGEALLMKQDSSVIHARGIQYYIMPLTKIINPFSYDGGLNITQAVEHAARFMDYSGGWNAFLDVPSQAAAKFLREFQK